nr:hypothetical protein [uncultured Gellertiella sp.]
MNRRKMISLTGALLGAACLATQAFAGVQPCEDALRDLRAAKATAKLSDADVKTVEDLEAKVVERCNADDDKRADKFAAEAMKVLGK